VTRTATLPCHIVVVRDIPREVKRAVAVVAIIAALAAALAIEQGAKADALAEADRLRATVAQQAKRLDAPAVRVDIESNGFTCSAWRVRESWAGVAAQKCQEPGQFLIMAQSVK